MTDLLLYIGGAIVLNALIVGGLFWLSESARGVWDGCGNVGDEEGLFTGDNK